MRLPSWDTLIKIAAGVGLIGISGVMILQKTIENRARNADYYRLALQALRQNQGAVRLLGEPIKETGFDVNDIEKNHWDENRAAFEVTVSGPKDKGKMFFQATKDKEKGWSLDQLELEVRNEPKKRFLIVKSANTAKA